MCDQDSFLLKWSGKQQGAGRYSSCTQASSACSKHTVPGSRKTKHGIAPPPAVSESDLAITQASSQPSCLPSNQCSVVAQQSEATLLQVQRSGADKRSRLLWGCEGGCGGTNQSSLDRTRADLALHPSMQPTQLSPSSHLKPHGGESRGVVLVNAAGRFEEVKEAVEAPIEAALTGPERAGLEASLELASDQAALSASEPVRWAPPWKFAQNWQSVRVWFISCSASPHCCQLPFQVRLHPHHPATDLSP